MLQVMIISSAIILVTIWAIMKQRELVILDENVNDALSQIGMQLTSCYDLLIALLDLEKAYAGFEIIMLIEYVRAKRVLITAKSKPKDIALQEKVITEALGRIIKASETYSDIKADQNFNTMLDAMETYETMVRSSRLLYNYNVRKLNCKIRLFPVSVLAGILGFRKRKTW